MRSYPVLYRPMKRKKQYKKWLLAGLLGSILLSVLLAFVIQKQQAGPALMLTTYAPDQGVLQPAPVKKQQTIAPASFNASKQLQRVYQLDPAQYASPQEYNTWAYAACSAAAMTEAMNAYGKHYSIHEVLSYEAAIGMITPELGLLKPTGIDATVAHFGFTTTWMNAPTLDQAIAVANAGHPLIINFPPDRWDGGHILVMVGGNVTSVHLADSSRLNMQWMARATFLKYWAGWAVAVESRA